MRRQRGFTLVELAIVAALVALLALGAAVALGNKPYALRSSVMMLNASLAQARAIAESSGNGATLAVVPHGSGTLLYLYRGRPSDPAGTIPAGPPVELQASLSEATLGPAPFSIFIDGSGHVTGPPCPAAPVTIAITAGGASEPAALYCQLAN